MKRIISIISAFLALTLTATSFSAAEIILGAGKSTAVYSVHHYIESHVSPDETLILDQTFEEYVGLTTQAEALEILGYTADKFKQGIVMSDSSSVVDVHYTMDGFETGDVNCDGYIDLLDTAVLQRKIAGWDGYDYQKACIYTSDMNSDGEASALDALILINQLAENKIDTDNNNESKVTVSFNVHGDVTSYQLTPGDSLSDLSDIVFEDLSRYSFVGWYNSAFTKQYSVVPNTDTTLYAKYANYTGFGFDNENSSIYDPNNKKFMTLIDDPFGNGNVIHTNVYSSTANNGTLRGFCPTVYDGIDGGYKLSKGKTYTVSFKYRYSDNASLNTSCVLTVYAANAAGICQTGSKSDSLAKTFLKGSSTLSNKGDWYQVIFKFTNNTDYLYPYIRFSNASVEGADFYLDDFVIIESSSNDTNIKLVNNGETEISSLKVGNALPTLSAYYDPVTDLEYAFEGWYDSTLTNKYSNVVSGNTTYYAKYKNYTGYSFESGGLYDPNSRYTPTSGNIAAWYRIIDPTDSTNICMRAALSNNTNNTHFALSSLEGVGGGYKLTSGSKYIISFDYYIDTTATDFNGISISVRGAADANIGASEGKSGEFGSTKLSVINKWDRSTLWFTATSDVANFSNLIFLAQTSTNHSYLELLIDNFSIRKFSSDSDIKSYTPAKNITLNDSGKTQTYNNMYTGELLNAPKGYYGATFKGWYNENLNTPYTTVPAENTTLYSVYNGEVLTFENGGGYYDPNGHLGSFTSAFSISQDPTNDTNTTLKVDLTGNAGNSNFCLGASAYSTGGYKMTIGNTYEISFMYYAEKLGNNGVSVQFRGCKEENIGTTSGKSIGYGGTRLTKVGVWTGVTVKFTYRGTDLTDVVNPYLIMLAQDGSYPLGSKECTAIVHFDDIVIKETEPAKTYTQKTNKIGGWTLGYEGNNRQLYIVVPEFNFSYIARLQCENLVEVIKGITTTEHEAIIINEDEWKETDNQSNIFIGNVTGHSRDKSRKIDTSSFTSDDYAFCIGTGNVYIDGGSTYALAMGISEFAKALEECADGYNFQIGTLVTGKYSEKIGSYSSKTYYRPTFLEDFDGDEVDLTKWDNIDGMIISSANGTTYTVNGVKYPALNKKQSKRTPDTVSIDDGKLIITPYYDDNYYHGAMLQTHGKMEYKYGYLEISCITPNGSGIWTALWTTNNHTTGLWASEVDINESFGDARYTAFNMHSWPTNAGSLLGYDHYSLDRKYGTAKRADAGSGKTFNDTFHTFGYWWTADEAKFIVDGEVYFEYNPNDPTNTSNTSFGSTFYHDDVDAFNEFLSLKLSMTVSNSTGIQYRVEETATPDEWKNNKEHQYVVDYVHIYQIDGQEIIFSENQ